MLYMIIIVKNYFGMVLNSGYYDFVFTILSEGVLLNFVKYFKV